MLQIIPQAQSEGGLVEWDVSGNLGPVLYFSQEHM